MTSYKLLLFLHVASVIVALGSGFAYPFLQAFAERTNTGATRFFLQFAKRLDKLITLPGILAIVLFGVGLIFEDATGYSDDFPTWLMIATTWYVVLVLLLLYAWRPAVSRALDSLDNVRDDAKLPAAYEPLGRRLQMIGGLIGISVIGITFLMTWKPGQ